jgi:ABC-type multidrug transport system fused ATPase/permease subunit
VVRLPFSLSIPHWVAQTIGALVARRGRAAVLRNVALLFACGTVDALLDFWCVFLFAYAQHRVVRDLRTSLFRAVLSQEAAFFDRELSGVLTSRLNTDTAVMANDLTWVFRFTIEACVRIAGIAGYMLWRSPRLASVAVAVVPLTAAVNRCYARWMTRNADRVQEALAAANASAQEALAAVRTVFSFAGQPLAAERYEAKVRRHYALNVKQAGITALYYMVCSTFLVNTCVQAALLLYGASLCGWGETDTGERMSPTVLLAFMLYQGQLQEYFQNLFNSFTSLVQSAGAGRKVLRLLEREPRPPRAVLVPAPSGPRAVGPAPSGPPRRLRGHVAFRNVRFGYPPAGRDDGAGSEARSRGGRDGRTPTAELRSPALRGVSFEARPGQTVALVGASGAGKSTVLSLLQRLYEPTSGRIELDGIDLSRQDALPDWRLHGAVATVGQEPVLMSGTIEANIRYGAEAVACARAAAEARRSARRPPAGSPSTGPVGRGGPARAPHARPATPRDGRLPDFSAVEAAARAANAHGFITTTPKGYGAEVGERGARLSGGERQRVAIARALLLDPAVLLLDEATSALDSGSEAAVQAALARASEGRTTIVVAHRLSTVRTADLILVLDAGRVVQRGTHEELMAQGAWRPGAGMGDEAFASYASMVAMQGGERATRGTK